MASSRLWLPSQSATTAREFRKIIERYALLTGGDMDFIDWQGHDFSFRGMGAPEAAVMSGGGHLLSFKGTDTIPSIKMLHDVYEGEGRIGGSVFATEHMVMCLDGRDNEKNTYERMLNKFPTGVLAQVSDTWDLWNVITTILPSLKDKIMIRKGKLVIRPDSGDPVLILTGDASSSDWRARKGVIELLWDEFGGTMTGKGFRQLDNHIGAIYGDSITKTRAVQIFERLMAKGFASTNVVLGIGSYTYQYTTRDESGYAMKATWALVNGHERFLFKDPITDSGMKRSARGRLAVIQSMGQPLRLVDGLDYAEWERYNEDGSNLLQPVWRDGRFLRRDKLADIRKRVRG
jgi:nicotinamide phosphoribosyltransferase